MQRYKLEAAIGDGAYGTVYRGVDQETGELVAVKDMKRPMGGVWSWEEAKRLPEVLSLAKLPPHPHVVRLRQVIHEGSRLLLVFEYANGGNLAELNYRAHKVLGRGLGEGVVVRVMCQLLSGVQHLHRHGFFHRDLKPDNVLLSRPVSLGPAPPSAGAVRASALEVLLADMGQVRETRSRPPYTPYVSTRWYRAPELLLRARHYNSPVDVWACGCVMAELLLGKPIFPGTSEANQLFCIVTVLGSPTPAQWPDASRLATALGIRIPHAKGTGLKATLPHASPEAIQFLQAALEWNPAKRPSATALLKHPFLATTTPSTATTAHHPDWEREASANGGGGGGRGGGVDEGGRGGGEGGGDEGVGVEGMGLGMGLGLRRKEQGGSEKSGRRRTGEHTTMMAHEDRPSSFYDESTTTTTTTTPTTTPYIPTRTPITTSMHKDTKPMREGRRPPPMQEVAALLDELSALTAESPRRGEAQREWGSERRKGWEGRDESEKPYPHFHPPSPSHSPIVGVTEKESPSDSLSISFLGPPSPSSSSHKKKSSRSGSAKSHRSGRSAAADLEFAARLTTPETDIDALMEEMKI